MRGVIRPAVTIALLCVTGFSSAQTYKRTESITYHDNLSKWVLGQVASVRCLSAVPTSGACNGNDYSNETTYNSNALPETVTSFGKVQQTLTYSADGTLKTVKDGRNYVTTLSSWYRGVPRQIQYPGTSDHPSGTSQSATVDANGWITSVTDENGYQTCYQYDAMGRLARIVYPSRGEESNACSEGGPNDWNPTILSFTGGHPATRGLAAGHWRQTITTGAGKKTTLFDALWRPVVETTCDNTSPTPCSTTRSEIARRYDAAGRMTFESYPVSLVSDFKTIAAGTSTSYDALGRVTLVRQTSELGNLDTTTQYLTGFKTRVTLPKHQGLNPAVYTETSYVAWDAPTLDFPATIAQPEGIGTVIDRDALGKPLAIIRGSGGNTVTRSYEYNVYHELCKSVEPETGATLYGYDAAGNLSWSAAGQSAGLACTNGTTPPATALTRAARRTHDARNRLKTLRFSDTRGDQDWYYAKDGLPTRVVTVNVPGTVHPENQYGYDKRRNLTTEVQFLPAWYSFSVGYTYNANGHLSRINYPSSDYVDFAPNALGQPTKAVGAGSRVYAQDVSYHPNGTIAGFGYGNGVAYTMEQNTRQLPLRVNSANVQKYEYAYDKNGNPATIFDQTRGNTYSRVLQYDDLDRLTGAGSASFGGADHWHRFTYDALDNLVTWKHAGVRDSRYCYDAANRLQFLRAGATTCSNGAATDYFQYDPQGNVELHDGTAFDFDYGNRLREVLDVERYRYDAHGRRILAMNFATGTLFSQYGQTGQLLYQKNTRTGENRQTDHVYLGGSLIAQREQPLTPANAPVTVRFVHTDALGSPVAVTNAANPTTGIERMEYNPYGEQRATTATIGRDRPGYTGHVLDQASGLNYMEQRYYDPTIGRFLSVDPVTAYSSGNWRQLNRYGYAFNNPYAFTDPDGRVPIAIPIIVGASACAKNTSCRIAVARAVRWGGAAVAGALGAREGMRQANESAEPTESAKEPIPGAVDLVDDLAGQEVKGQIEAGEGKVLSGMGDKKFDPETGTHDKVAKSRDNADGTQTEVHADRNRQTGEAENVKIKQQGQNCRQAAGCGE